MLTTCRCTPYENKFLSNIDVICQVTASLQKVNDSDGDLTKKNVNPRHLFISIKEYLKGIGRGQGRKGTEGSFTATNSR